MADAAGSTSSCRNEPESSAKDVHHHHLEHETESAKLPEYSQQPVEGIDMLVQVIKKLRVYGLYGTIWTSKTCMLYLC